MKHLYIALLLLSILSIPLFGKEATEPHKPFPEFEVVQVVRVVDGDTLVINSPSCGEQKIRLVGVDTPENTTKKEPFGEEASEFVREKVKECGYVLTLEADGLTYDKFDRRIAVAWLGRDKEQSLNALLLQEGLAIAETDFPFSKENKKLFTSEERKAFLGLKGIWGYYDGKIEKIRKREEEIIESF